jgi:hypothetical protein
VTSTGIFESGFSFESAASVVSAVGRRKVVSSVVPVSCATTITLRTNGDVGV